MPCAKRIISMTVRERSFMIYDRDKPYELVIQYKLLAPKQTGIITFEFVHTEFSRGTLDDVNSDISFLENGGCFQCEFKSEACELLNPAL